MPFGSSPTGSEEREGPRRTSAALFFTIAITSSVGHQAPPDPPGTIIATLLPFQQDLVELRLLATARRHDVLRHVVEDHVNKFVEASQRPTTSLSPFMMTQMRDPMHLSTSSGGGGGRPCLLVVACLVRRRACREAVAAADWCGAALVEMSWRAVGNAVCLSKARVVHGARRVEFFAGRGGFFRSASFFAC